MRDTQQRLRSYLNVSKDTGDGATANTTKHLANPTNQEQWMGLCELGSNEHDEGILRLLEDQQMRLSTAADDMPHNPPALI